MRDLVYNFILDNPVTGFKVTNELPWTKGGAPLFHKNLKTIYVDQPDVTSSPLFDTLDGMSAVDETTTVSVYVVTDAKQLPSNYETLVSTLRNGKLDVSFNGNTQKQTPVTVTYEGDNAVTQFDFIFNKFNM